MTAPRVPNPFLEAQLRAGVPDVDALLAERHRLITEHAEMLARFGNSAKFFDVERKKHLSLAYLRARDACEKRGERATEKLLEAMAHADPAYLRMTDEGFLGMCRYEVVADEIDAVTQRILRGGQVMKYGAWEPR